MTINLTPKCSYNQPDIDLYFITQILSAAISHYLLSLLLADSQYIC